MTPAEYAQIVVIPTVREFMEKPDDQRLLYLACITSYHLVDHISRATNLGTGAVGNRLSADPPINREAFDIVQGICHGTKHAEVTHKNTPYKFKAGADRPVEGFIWDGPETNGWDSGNWDGPARAVVYEGANYLVHHCVARFLWRVEHEYSECFVGVDWVEAHTPNIQDLP